MEASSALNSASVTRHSTIFTKLALLRLFVCNLPEITVHKGSGSFLAEAVKPSYCLVRLDAHTTHAISIAVLEEVT